MTKREKAELLLICIAAVAAWFLAAKLPHNLRAGEVVLVASGVLLFQGLLRDLWIKYVVKPLPVCHLAPSSENPAPQTATNAPSSAPAPPRKILCMCMESTVGASGVIAGCAILLCGIRTSVDLPRVFWPLLILIVCAIGFAIKDLVIDWKTWKIRHEKDHQSIIPW